MITKTWIKLLCAMLLVRVFFKEVWESSFRHYIKQGAPYFRQKRLARNLFSNYPTINFQSNIFGTFIVKSIWDAW